MKVERRMGNEDDELERLRQKRMAEMQNQMAQRQAEDQYAQQQQREMYEAQKEAILQKILSSEARARLTNIRMARPEFAEQIEMSLIQAVQTGALRGKIPLGDDDFKLILQKLQQQSPKREGKIRIQ